MQNHFCCSCMTVMLQAWAASNLDDCCRERTSVISQTLIIMSQKINITLHVLDFLDTIVTLYWCHMDISVDFDNDILKYAKWEFHLYTNGLTPGGWFVGFQNVMRLIGLWNILSKILCWTLPNPHHQYSFNHYFKLEYKIKTWIYAAAIFLKHAANTLPIRYWLQ
jgi:hypothetical protein